MTFSGKMLELRLMGRRKRIPDRYNIGGSQVIPFQPGESGGDRHASRLKSNLQGPSRLTFRRPCGKMQELKNG
jgi:hypothetical protein